MSLFRKIVVAVPDIKEHLVREYERVRELQKHITNLETQLDATREVKLKYDAALVTLDEYSKRFALYETKLKEEKQRSAGLIVQLSAKNDELNTYKIKLHDAGITKEEIADKIIADFQTDLISEIVNYKGHLSKNTVCRIIKGEVQ